MAVMKKMVLIVLLVLGCFGQSGEEFYQQCMPGVQCYEDSTKCTDETLQIMPFCLGQVVGIANTSKFYQQAYNQKSICWPTYSVSPEQILNTALKEIKNNPETAHYKMTSLVVRSLQKAFPCDK